MRRLPRIFASVHLSFLIRLHTYPVFDVSVRILTCGCFCPLLLGRSAHTSILIGSRGNNRKRASDLLRSPSRSLEREPRVLSAGASFARSFARAARLGTAHRVRTPCYPGAGITGRHKSPSSLGTAFCCNRRFLHAPVCQTTLFEFPQAVTADGADFDLGRPACAEIQEAMTMTT